MQKIIFVVLLALAGYAVYDHRVQLKLVPPPPVAAAAGKPVPITSTHPGAAPAAAPATPAAAPAAPVAVASPAGPSAVRTRVEPLLATLKVTSMMLGDPPLVIINKRDYSVGDPLDLPGAKGVKVAAIDEGGVTLRCENEAFHLPAPAAPDLAASRKKL